MTGADEGHVSALDLPQQFEEAGSFQVRDQLQKLVEDDLLGPWDGEAEQCTPRAMGPRERYLVGMLGPKHQPKSTLDDTGNASDAESGVQGDTRGEEAGELPEVLTPQNLGRIWASSMGLSFCVGADTDALAVTAAWGQYCRQETEDDEGRKRTVWAREPREFRPETRLDGESDQRIPLTATDLRDPCVYLAVAVRAQGARRTVELTLVNNQQEPMSTADTAWLFQATLTVTALDGAAPVFLPIDDPLEDIDPARDDAEELHLRLLYRDRLKFATGHNVAVHVHLTRRALRDATRCSSDPLCQERLPQPHADFLHGAACHVCLFVSETTCERGNRFLDRRFVVPIDTPELALLPDLP